MRIHLKEVAAQSDQTIWFQYTTDLSDLEVHFCHPVRFPAEVRGCVSERSGVLRLEGEIEVASVEPCAGCGCEVTTQLCVPLDFVLTDDPNDESEDTFYVEGGAFETDDAFVPELILHMDMTVRCGPDCPGSPGVLPEGSVPYKPMAELLSTLTSGQEEEI